MAKVCNCHRKRRWGCQSLIVAENGGGGCQRVRWRFPKRATVAKNGGGGLRKRVAVTHSVAKFRR